MDFVVSEPNLKGKNKQYGLIIRMPTEQCSDEERDYMRAKYISKLLEWKRAELEEEQKLKVV